MAKEVELERTFLLKKMPDNLEEFSSHEILDVYFPKEEFHPKITFDTENPLLKFKK